MRKPIIVAAQKLYLNHTQAVGFAKCIRETVASRRFDFEVLISPSFISLAHVVEVLRDSGVLVAAQNFHQVDSGGLTGQVSLRELLDLEVPYVMLGHSEVRKYQGDTDEVVREKIRACIAQGVRPIICVGESATEHEAGRADQILELQVVRLLGGLDGIHKAIVAYEPEWGVRGVPEIASMCESIRDAHAVIRQTLKTHCGGEAGDLVRILYGGGVTQKIVHTLIVIPGVDGVLLGRDGVSETSFVSVLDSVEKVLVRGLEQRNRVFAAAPFHR